MQKPIKKIIKENNEKRKLLTEENLNYYENFLTYVRSNLFKDERATEEVLLEIVDHLLLAQEEGKSAEDVFGKNPQQLADDVVENLPIEPFRFQFLFGIELMATLLAVYTLVLGIFDIIVGNAKTIYIGNTIFLVAALMGVLSLIIVLVMKMLKQESFKKTKSKKFYFLIVGTMTIGSVAIAFVATKLPNFGRAVVIGEYGMFSIGCLLMLITFILKKIREQR